MFFFSPTREERKKRKEKFILFYFLFFFFCKDVGVYTLQSYWFTHQVYCMCTVYMYWWFRCCSAAPVVVVEAIFLFRRKPAEVPAAILHRNVCEIIKLRIAASASDAATATSPTQPSIDRFPFLFFLFSFSIPGGIEYRLIWYRFSIFLLLPFSSCMRLYGYVCVWKWFFSFPPLDCYPFGRGWTE